MNARQSVSLILQQQIIPLYYHDDVLVCLERMNALYNAGVRVIEFTNRGDNALSNFSQMIARRNESFPDLQLGVGTIFSYASAESFFSVGADFLVSPVFSSAVLSYANKKNILYIPGCFTPSEINTAVTAGCSLIKIFPAQVLGSSFIKSVKELFPEVHFMATGGIKLTELNTWFEAGVSAIGVGGPLFSSVSTSAELETKMREMLQQTVMKHVD